MYFSKKITKATQSLYINMVGVGVNSRIRRDGIEPQSVYNISTGKSVICRNGYDLWATDSKYIKSVTTEAEAILWLAEGEVSWN